jgi:hypothetical protein
MVSKKSSTTSTDIFELTLTHPDILDMMNDPDVNLAGGVENDQVFDVVVRRNSGSEIVAGQFTTTDTLIFRFRKRTVQVDETSFTDIDIS